MKNTLTREFCEAKLNASRINLLLMIGLTAMNVVLLLTGSDTMMLFSATIPYFALLFSDSLAIGLAVAGICIVLYLLCWFFSKNDPVWMIVAAVLFVIDSAVMAWIYVQYALTSGVMDVLIHVYVLYILISGVYYGLKLRKLPSESAEHAVPLYAGNAAVSFETFAQATVAGHAVVYRRVETYNELVIDGMVYDNLQTDTATPHTLFATIDGHRFEAVFNGEAHTLIVDGQVV